MIRILSLLTVLLLSPTTWSQKGSWSEKQVYPIKDGGVWSIDGLENVYIAQFGLINKFDSTGKLKFSQSIKSLGAMTQLVPVNTMKLIHFSEEQQTICFLDNTLSPLDDCIDLTEEGIVNAGMVSESNQPNKIWVLDNLNSRLLLLPLDNVYQTQELMNLQGVLDLNQVTQFVERNNQVILLDATKGVYIFDLYGSLLDYFPEKDVLAVDANEHMLFLLRADGLYIRSFDSDETLRVDLPVPDARDFAYRNHFFFFRTEYAVHKFALQFSE